MQSESTANLAQRRATELRNSITEEKTRSATNSGPSLTIEDVALNEIDSEDRTFQYRLSAAIGDLKESLKANGQREPVDLSSSRPHRIIDGFRRIGAMRALGWTRVKAIVRRGISIEEAHEIAFTNNVVRKNLTSIEKAHAVLLARERGMPREMIAKNYSMSLRQLARYEKLADFPREIRCALNEGRLTMAHARVLANAQVKDPRPWIERAASGLAVRLFQRELRAASGSRSPGRKRNFVKKGRASLRVYSITCRKDTSQEELLRIKSALKEAIAALDGWLRHL